MNIIELLQIKKTVYAKRKRVKFTTKELADIINLEIAQHVKKHSFLIYDNYTKLKNDDQSITYTLTFKLRK